MSVTKSLVLINICFIISHALQGSRGILALIQSNYSLHNKMFCLKGINILFRLSMLAVILNAGTNFFIFVAMNKNFRQEYRKVLCRKSKIFIENDDGTSMTKQKSITNQSNVKSTEKRISMIAR